MIEMLEGLEHMHAKNFVHRDLKPANVLITCPDEVMQQLKRQRYSTVQDVCHAKIADLGLTCTLGAKGTCGGVAGTPLYMPPELLATRTIHYANDVWALGLIFYELVLKEIPLPLRQARTIDDLNRKIKTLKVSMSTSAIKTQLGCDQTEADKVKAIIEFMLKLDPKQRLTASAALGLAKQLKIDSGLPPVVSGALPACWDKSGEPEPEPPAPTKPVPAKPAVKPVEPEPEPDAGMEDSVDLGDIDSDSDEEFLVIKAKRAGGDVGVNFVVNWLVGDLDYERMVKDKYTQKILPNRMREGKFVPVEVNGIAVSEIRKDKHQYMDPMKNGILGEALVIKMLKTK